MFKDQPKSRKSADIHGGSNNYKSGTKPKEECGEDVIVPKGDPAALSRLRSAVRGEEIQRGIWLANTGGGSSTKYHYQKAMSSSSFKAIMSRRHTAGKARFYAAAQIHRLYQKHIHSRPLNSIVHPLSDRAPSGVISRANMIQVVADILDMWRMRYPAFRHWPFLQENIFKSDRYFEEYKKYIFCINDVLVLDDGSIRHPPSAEFNTRTKTLDQKRKQKGYRLVLQDFSNLKEITKEDIVLLQQTSKGADIRTSLPKRQQCMDDIIQRLRNTSSDSHTYKEGNDKVTVQKPRDANKPYYQAVKHVRNDLITMCQNAQKWFGATVGREKRVTLTLDNMPVPLAAGLDNLSPMGTGRSGPRTNTTNNSKDPVSAGPSPFLLSEPSGASPPKLDLNSPPSPRIDAKKQEPKDPAINPLKKSPKLPDKTSPKLPSSPEISDKNKNNNQSKTTDGAPGANGSTQTRPQKSEKWPQNLSTPAATPGWTPFFGTSSANKSKSPKNHPNRTIQVRNESLFDKAVVLEKIIEYAFENLFAVKSGALKVDRELRNANFAEQ